MLGDEITEKGSTFTIRDFNEIPFTPIDLINWGTYSMDQIVYLWLAVENGKSGIIAGGTASGKTTTLNAISLFIPATEKIVSIEDTRELQVPQKMWVPLNTRESFSDNENDNIDEIDLLWNSLRMSPEYVIYGEVRGKEARSLFQNLNTGHTAYSTFHGNNAKEVRVRLTTDPINVDDTSFAGLDMIITQEQVAIDGKKVRRAKNITELEEYITEYNEFSTSNPFTWDQSADEFTGDLSTANIESNSPLMEEIRNENGWSKERMQKEIKQRKVVLAYLIDNGIREYTDVAATIQGYMYSKESVLAKIAEGSLSSETESFQEIKNIDIDVNTDLESGVPRPQANSKTKSKARNILEENKDLYQDITATDDPNAGDIKQLDGKKGPSTEQNTNSEGVWSND
jgi:flagellar protein FlaI